MTDLFTFLSSNGCVGVTAVIVAGFVAVAGFQLVAILFVRLPNRFWRHRNIRAHGWPPPHCDADGDFRPDEGGE